jgi:hypothetical protein
MLSPWLICQDFRYILSDFLKGIFTLKLYPKLIFVEDTFLFKRVNYSEIN